MNIWKKFKVAIYLRLSKEDDDFKEESASITNKRKRPMKDGKPTDYSKYSLRYPFSSKIVCGYCGAIFTRKMGRAKQNGTRTPYWACQRRAQERYDCEDSKFIRESLLKLKGDPFLAEKSSKRFLCSSVLAQLVLLLRQNFDFGQNALRSG